MKTKITWFKKNENIAVLLIKRNKKSVIPIFFRAKQDSVAVHSRSTTCPYCCVSGICGGTKGGPKYKGIDGFTYYCCNIFKLDKQWILSNSISLIIPVTKNELEEFKKKSDWKKLYYKTFLEK